MPCCLTPIRHKACLSKNITDRCWFAANLHNIGGAFARNVAFHGQQAMKPWLRIKRLLGNWQRPNEKSRAAVTPDGGSLSSR
jgi:hypothetical protein